MQRFEERQFTARYNKLMWVTLAVVLLISFALIGQQLREQKRSEDAQLVAQLKTQAQAIDNLIVGAAEHVRLMQAQAQRHFLDQAQGTSRLRAALRPGLRPDGGPGYSLDEVPPPFNTRDIGNLTGDGSLAEVLARAPEELDMALGLNKLFSAIKVNIPNAAWVYYTSKGSFINIYPWVSSSKSRFDPVFYGKPFYTLAEPATNPRREVRWTPLYHDAYGEGMMVTATAPVYREAEFLGAVSIDITVKELTAYMRGFGGGVGSLMIVNDSNQVIAHSSATRPEDTTALLLKDVLPKALQADASRLLQVQALSPVREGDHLVLRSPLENAPWQVLYVASEPGLLAGAFSRAGLVFAALLGGLAIIILVMRSVTFREFIRPAESLVKHIYLEGQGTAGPVGVQPVQWLPWFGEVSRAFESNRMLVREIQDKNQQLTDLNVSLERYTPRFILLLGAAEGVGGTALGNCFADALARQDPTKSTVYLEYPLPAKAATDLGLDGAKPVHRHPNGYDIWASYELPHVPPDAMSSLLMAKLLNQYDNVVMSATVAAQDDAVYTGALEPMFRYAKAVVMVVPPHMAGDPAVAHMTRQVKKNVRLDQAHVFVLSNPTRPGGTSAADADFELPFVEGGLRPGKEAFDCPAPVARVIDKVVDRVARVHQIVAFIPTTVGVNKAADTREVLERTVSVFAKLFGGATVDEREGAWNSDDEGVVREKIYRVLSYITDTDLSLRADEAIDFIRKIKTELGQEAMAVEINRKLILI